MTQINQIQEYTTYIDMRQPLAQAAVSGEELISVWVICLNDMGINLQHSNVLQTHTGLVPVIFSNNVKKIIFLKGDI